MRLLAAALAILLATPALAEDATPPPIDFAPAVDRVIDAVIVPGYQALADAATGEAQAMQALCAMPGADALATARNDFATLVVAWSGVEMYRIGPARGANRYERLFFWPDRRGLGLRQVQAILTERDESATDVATLTPKSVAVQGILALEYVLHGDDADTLATAPADSFRCRYGRAIARAIAATATDILAGWTAPDTGYASVMRNAGPDDPVYRSAGEAFQDILRSAREQLTLVRDIKIARPLRDSAAAAIPRQAPLWRSNLTIPSLRANIAAVRALAHPGDIASVMPSASADLVLSLQQVLEIDDAALGEAAKASDTWETIVRDEAGYQTLVSTLPTLHIAVELLERHIPAALGLVTGFNTLDGD